MTSFKKLKMLVGIVSLAFVLCASYGIFNHEKRQMIKNKNHGYKTTSFSRVGLDKLQFLLKSGVTTFQQEISKFLRYLKIRYTQDQNTKHSLSGT